MILSSFMPQYITSRVWCSQSCGVDIMAGIGTFISLYFIALF